MRPWMIFNLSAAGIMLFAAMLCAQEPKPPVPPTTEIDCLIAQLGSPTFAAREEASQKLDELGPAALDSLRKAAKGDDAEVRRRAGDLVQCIERRVETERLLAPRRVHLVYRDTPLREAVDDFARKAGCLIELGGDRWRVVGRKITLDTGEVPFWRALELFCEQAGLVELRNDPVADVDKRIISPSDPARKARVIDLRGVRPESQDNRLVLVDGKPPSLPTFHYGALRIRALPTKTELKGASRSAGEVVVPLEIVPEPGIDWKRVLGVRIDRAVDQQGRVLSVPPPPVGSSSEDLGGSEEILVISDGDGVLPITVPRLFPLRLKEGERSPREIKELSGTLTAQVQTPPEPIFTVNKVLDSVGQTFQTGDGTALRLLSARRSGDEINLRVAVSTEPPDVCSRPLVGRVVRVNRRMRTWPANLPTEGGKPVLTLLDGKGKAIELMTCALDVTTAGGRTTKEFQLTYRGREEPARLIFTGRRLATVEVAFVLKDIPLK